MAYFLTLTYKFNDEQIKKVSKHYKIDPDDYGTDFDYKEDLTECLGNFSGKNCDKYGTLWDVNIDIFEG